MDSKDSEYNKLSPKLALQLCAPHTWAASIFPVLLSVCVAIAMNGTVSLVASIALLAIAIFLQSAVNSLNDYFDFKSGADTEEDNLEEGDSVLVFNNVNPKSAFWLSIGLIVTSLIVGIYCIYLGGWFPLVIAMVGIIIILLYSGGKTPISYLPIGELVSGFVMGMLLPFACYSVLANTIDSMMLVYGIPCAIGIALIMLTNNTCDIEKDIASNRRTLPVLLGRESSWKLYRSLVIIWYVSMIAIVCIWFRTGIVALIFAVFATLPLAKALISNPKEPSTRIQAMGQISNMNIALGAFFSLAIVASIAGLLIW